MEPEPVHEDLMEIVCCPVCKGELTLTVEKKDDKGEIEAGTLRCDACAFDYPIEDGIPNLLPPEFHKKDVEASD